MTSQGFIPLRDQVDDKLGCVSQRGLGSCIVTLGYTNIVLI